MSKLNDQELFDDYEEERPRSRPRLVEDYDDFDDSSTDDDFDPEFEEFEYDEEE